MKGEARDVEKFGPESAARRPGLWIKDMGKTIGLWLNYVQKKPSTLNINK
jgi:hypothetical protein